MCGCLYVRSNVSLLHTCEFFFFFPRPPRSYNFLTRTLICRPPSVSFVGEAIAHIIDNDKCTMTMAPVINVASSRDLEIIVNTRSFITNERCSYPRSVNPVYDRAHIRTRVYVCYIDPCSRKLFSLRSTRPLTSPAPAIGNNPFAIV